MGDDSAFKALCRETKALILVSEFEAKRMPMFQLRAVLNAMIIDNEEKKTVIDLVDRDLRASGHPPDQVAAFLGDLVASVHSPAPLPTPAGGALQTTRRLRSPFALGFENGPPPADGTVAVPLPRGVVPPPNVFEHRTDPAHTAEMPPAPPPAVPQKSAPTPLTPPAPPSASPPGATAGAPAKGGKNALRKTPENGPAAGLQPVGTKMFSRAEEALFFGGKPSGMKMEREKRPVVLVADDDARIRMVFKLKLEDAGFAVVEAANGDEAWKLIQDGPQAVVLDMKMPGQHGLEVLAKMTDGHLKIPVVVCSAHDQLKEEFVVATYPCLRYLVKPVSPNDVIKSVRELLGSQKG